MLATVREFFRTGVLPKGVNDMSIVLIPKVPNPKTLKDYRPISLCNVVYKIIAKMVVSRLKIFLPYIVSPTQCAFVPGRMNTNNVLAGHECFHTIKNKREAKEGWCAIKLDMHQAYDWVE